MGSKLFLATEINNKKYSNKRDIYSQGIVMQFYCYYYFLLVENTRRYFRRKKECDLGFDGDFWNPVSNHIKKLFVIWSRFMK